MTSTPPTDLTKLTTLDRLRITQHLVAELLLTDKVNSLTTAYALLTTEIMRRDGGILAHAAALLGSAATIPAAPAMPLQAAPLAATVPIPAPDPAPSPAPAPAPDRQRVAMPPLKAATDEHLTTEQVAQALQIDAQTLANERFNAKGRGEAPIIPFVKAGRQYMYLRSDLEKLLRNNPKRVQTLQNRHAAKKAANRERMLNGKMPGSSGALHNS